LQSRGFPVNYRHAAASGAGGGFAQLGDEHFVRRAQHLFGRKPRRARLLEPSLRVLVTALHALVTALRVRALCLEAF
jgi:hypothetical protein